MGGQQAVLINPPGSVLGPRNAILSGNSVPYVVARFVGPLSIKWMLQGSGVRETPDGRHRADSTVTLVLNRGQEYWLLIDDTRPRESFCVFFGESFVADVRRALETDAHPLRDDPAGGCAAVEFPEQLEPVTPTSSGVAHLLRRMHAHLRTNEADDAWLDDQFHELTRALLEQRSELQLREARLPALRASTRQELMRRLQRARDLIHDRPEEPLTIAGLARVACLSSHHFHRSFRAAFGLTPQHYLTHLRLERARRLLVETDRSVTQICLDCGFSSLGSFSGRFAREYGLPPSTYRQRAVT